MRLDVMRRARPRPGFEVQAMLEPLEGLFAHPP